MKPGSKSDVCRYFEKGYCNRADQCAFQHVKLGSEVKYLQVSSVPVLQGQKSYATALMGAKKESKDLKDIVRAVSYTHLTLPTILLV